MEIDLNELEQLAKAAHKYNSFWFKKDDLEDLNIGSDDAALIARMSHDVVLELVRRLRAAEGELATERKALMHRLRAAEDALSKIAGLSMSQFLRPGNMASECVRIAGDAMQTQKGHES